MSKFVEQQAAIEGVFASSEWTSGAVGSIKVLPSNFQGSIPQTEFLRLEILPSKPNTNYSNFGSTGQVIVQVYTKGNTGLTRTMEIADALDESLQTKLFTTTNGSVQTGVSSLAVIGIEDSNAGFFRVDYTISYTYYAN